MLHATFVKYYPLTVYHSALQKGMHPAADAVVNLPVVRTDGNRPDPVTNGHRTH